ncbi:MAG: outer membrane beta-barrel family protein, partial [Muribaculaceae bacterium]|nr:outer membrane beta-barrel family protein [Muribaculaceae bacterium]
TNFYQALNEIPNLVAAEGLGLYYRGSDKVKILINGVDASTAEIEALAKDDVRKVNVYQIAPVRFLSQGYQSAVDIITKPSLTGGNLAVNIQQAFYPLKGDNNIAFFYNNRRSRFKTNFRNSNDRQNKIRQSDYLNYDFDGITYQKDKEGLDSPWHRYGNALTLGYQNNLPGSYLYSLSLTGDINHDRRDLSQMVTSDQTTRPYEASNSLFTRSKSINMDNYFEKTLGKDGNGGSVLADITYRMARSHYDSNYREFSDQYNPAPAFNARSLYDIHYQGVVATAQYQMPYKKWGQLSFAINNKWQYSRYSEAETESHQTSNNCEVTAMYEGRTGQFTYVASIGLGNSYTDDSTADHSYSIWNPVPYVSIFYAPIPQLSLSLGYTYRTTPPTIAELSQTEQWLDTKLVYHGNPELHPYRRHTVLFSAYLATRYVDASLQTGFMDTPGEICNYFLLTPEYVLETMVNLRKYRAIPTSLQLTAKPLGSPTWTISTYINMNRLWGAGETYDWRGFRFQWFTITQVNLNKWSIYANYQFPGKAVVGQLIMPRTQFWSIGASCRPTLNLSVGLELGCPFGKGWKESERTVNTAIVDRRTYTFARDMANVASLLFEWTLMFGRNRNQATQRFTNSIDETGILKK